MLTLTRSSVSRNGVFGLQSSDAGGIRNAGTLILVDSTVSSNFGGLSGPGGILNSGVISAVNSAVVRNTSGSDQPSGVGVESTGLC